MTDFDGVDVVVVGAGQAGLSCSHYLRQAGIDHVVLERAQIGDSWRGAGMPSGSTLPTGC